MLFSIDTENPGKKEREQKKTCYFEWKGYFHSTILIQRRRIGFFKRRQYNTRSAFSGTFGTLRTIRFGCCLADDDAAAAAAAAAAVADGVAGDTLALFVVDCAIFGGNNGCTAVDWSILIDVDVVNNGGCNVDDWGCGVVVGGGGVDLFVNVGCWPLLLLDDIIVGHDGFFNRIGGVNFVGSIVVVVVAVDAALKALFGCTRIGLIAVDGWNLDDWFCNDDDDGGGVDDDDDGSGFDSFDKIDPCCCCCWWLSTVADIVLIIGVVLLLTVDFNGCCWLANISKCFAGQIINFWFWI